MLIAAPHLVVGVVASVCLLLQGCDPCGDDCGVNGSPNLTTTTLSTTIAPPSAAPTPTPTTTTLSTTIAPPSAAPTPTPTLAPKSLVPTPSPSLNPTPKPTVSSDEVCYGELSALAVDEGTEVGKGSDLSADACRTSCSSNDECRSVSYCPHNGVWGGCFLKSRYFTGGEPVRQLERCVTYFQTDCGSLPPTTTQIPGSGSMKVRIVSYNLYWWKAFNSDGGANGHRITNNIRDNLHPDVLGVQECDSPDLIKERTGLQPASHFAGGQGVLMQNSLFVASHAGSEDLQATGKWGPRYVTWVRLKHRATNHAYFHFNTHWCVHECDGNKRKAGAQNMLAAIHRVAGNEPVIVTGDFNEGPGAAGVDLFLQNGFSLARNAWVDFIFYSTSHWRLTHAETGSHSGSDHAPILAEFEIL